MPEWARLRGLTEAQYKAYAAWVDRYVGVSFAEKSRAKNDPSQYEKYLLIMRTSTIGPEPSKKGEKTPTTETPTPPPVTPTGTSKLEVIAGVTGIASYDDKGQIIDFQPIGKEEKDTGQTAQQAELEQLRDVQRAGG